MTMSTCIHCLVDGEPAGYYDEPGTYAVNLSIDCFSDGGSDDDEKEAKAVFQLLLKLVQGPVHFIQYRRNGALLEAPEPIRAQLSEASVAIANPDDLFNWLHSRASEDEHERFWTRQAPSDHLDMVAVENAGAGPLLRAVQAWNAPVGHRCGLTYVIQVQHVAENTVVLPFFADAPIPDSLDFTCVPSDADCALLDCPGDFGSGLDNLSCRTTLLRPPSVETLGGRLTAEGYFKVNQQAIALHRLLNGFEHRASGLLAVTPSLMSGSKGQDSVQSDEAAYEQLFQITEHDSTDLIPLELVWAGISGLLSALDNIVIALMKPIALGTSEGELLTPLVSAIETALQRPELSRGSILKAVRDVLGQSPLIVAQEPPQAADARTISPLIPALRHVYGLSEKAGSDTALETQLLLILLQYAQEPNNQPTPQTLNGLRKAMGTTTPHALLMRALSGLQAQLADESGAETAVIRLFETAARFNGNTAADGDTSIAGLIARQLELITNDPAPQPTPGGDLPLANAWTRYCAILSGPFNGAEAVRRSASLEFINALFQDAELPQTENTPDPQALVQQIRQAQYFALRLTQLDSPVPCIFHRILQRLVRVTPTFSGTEDQQAAKRGIIERHLQRAYDATMNNLGDLCGEGLRFIPDVMPQPLPLQIAGDFTGSSFDHFLDDFNGIAMALRRDDLPGFAHANLAELRWGNSGAGKPALRIPAAIHPFLPTVNDGRGPAFVEYHGMPFADRSFAGLLADPAAQTDNSRQLRAPFYQVEVVSDLHEQPALPRLAYGRWFESFAFATTNAGVLPIEQRQSKSLPWLPGIPVRPADQAVIARTAYQRRTAIGDLEILEVGPDTNNQVSRPWQRFNRSLPDVVALASDYPRVSLVASVNAPGTLDLYRESDGIGSLAFDLTSRSFSLGLEDLRISGDVRRISLHLLNGPAPSPLEVPKNDSFSVELGKEYLTAKSLRLIFSTQPDTPLVHQVSIVRDQDDAPRVDLEQFQSSAGALFWLRVVLEVESGHGALSFATPEGPQGARLSPALLLLAPTEPKVWRADAAPSKVQIKVKTPRVGYLDFQRWMNNSALRDQAFGDPHLAEAFARDLMTLYTIRDSDPQLAQFFDRLPDPAVSEIRLTLCETDRLQGGTAFLPAAGVLSLDNRLAMIARDFTQAWPTNRRGAISKLMQDIDRQFSFRVDLSLAEASLNVETQPVHVSVPSGSVAHLCIETMVSRSLFSLAPDAVDLTQALGPIHAGLLQYASRSTASHYGFPGATICLEAMADALPHWKDDGALATHQQAIDLAERMIGFEAAASARRYSLIAGPNSTSRADRDAWRIYSHATVFSQQWLFSGRPLYRTLAPKLWAWGRKPEDAGLAVTDTALRLQNTARVYEFEEDIFFDRSNINADPLTCKLAPLPARTQLQTFTWDSPSATYWRHRVTLRSRYAGALQSASRREIDVFHPLDRNNLEPGSLPQTWTLRVAMLADLTRIQLTRPQLRALIPLTAAVAGGTPSVLAVLQEPPLAHGGLADRTSAELKTGFGYGFASNDSPVEILDARKEVGPDPTLCYSAMPDTLAQALVVAAEGPIGLTFDPHYAAAPVFANSMFSLTPTTLDNHPTGSLEEHFLGIVMQRYLDPDWLSDVPVPSLPDADGAPGQDAERCWWIEVSLESVKKEGWLLKFGDDEQPILKQDEQNLGQIYMRKAALDGVPGYEEPYVPLIPIPRNTSRIAFLHQPVTPGHYGLSIFMSRESMDISQGHCGAWLKVASLEWSPVDQKQDQTPARRLHLPQSALLRASAASATTFLAWTRTHRDFANLTLGSPQEDGATRVQVSELVARCDSQGQLSFHYGNRAAPQTAVKGASLYLSASTAANPQPLHLHRHLGFLVTRLRDEPGRPLEEFYRQGCRLFAGATARLPEPPASRERLNVRLVEIETPAVILSGTELPGIPQEYRQHVLDLEATGSGIAGQLKLFVRLVGSALHLRGVKRITLHLGFLKPGEQEPVAPVAPVAINLDLGKGIRAIELCLHPSQPSVTLIQLDGKTSTQVLPEVIQSLKSIASAVNDSVALVVGIDTPVDAGECWVDVSMLHTDLTAAPDTLDLHWLFSRDAPDDMAQALLPWTMANRTEAQARIVSVSPPIAVIQSMPATHSPFRNQP